MKNNMKTLQHINIYLCIPTKDVNTGMYHIYMINQMILGIVEQDLWKSFEKKREQNKQELYSHK